MPRVICIANQKGGIGKTTTATNIASILATKYKTLLIDADPQCNSTDTYRALVHNVPTLYDVLLDYDDPADINETIQSTEIGDIIPSDPLLKESDTKFKNDGEEYFRLKDAIDNLKDYEYVVIDTAPADNKLLKNCLVASDEIIIPITADRYGLQGLAEFNETINIIRKRNNPNLKISGLLLVKFHENYTIAKDVAESLEEISKQIGTKVFETRIRESTATQVAQAKRTTLIKHCRRATTYRDYTNFVYDELLGE